MATFGERIANFFNGNDADTQEGLHGLFVTELQDIYYAERQAVDALGEQADAATTDEVRSAFIQHQHETRNQVARLEQVFNSLGIDVESGTCDAIDGLVDDAQRVVSNTDSDSLTRDAGLIIAGQKIEHHEIAAYGSAVTLARVLGYQEAARLLEQTLEEEKNTDKRLTTLAESFINQQAADESSVNAGTYSSGRAADTGVTGTGISSDYGSATGSTTYPASGSSNDTRFGV